LFFPTKQIEFFEFSFDVVVQLAQVFPVMLLILLLWLIGIAAVSFGDPPLLAPRRDGK
jgi:hypothetical protein